MRKYLTRGVGAVLTAVCFVASGYGQQSTPPPATDYTPAAPGATTQSPATQTGIAPATSVETSPGIPLPADAQDPSLPAAATGRAAAAGQRAVAAPTRGLFPAPSAPAGRLDNDRSLIGTGAQNGARGTLQDEGQLGAANQRAELGVWLVETGGPGVEIRRITAGTAADQAGLQSGDVILQINGRGATSPQGVAQMIREMPPGQSAIVQYWRNGQISELDIPLQAAREQRVGFRGDDTLNEMNAEMNRDIGRGGDLESRTQRLEEQLRIVMQDLQAIRQQMAQSGSSSGSAAIGGAGIGTTSATATDASAPATGPASAGAAGAAPTSTDPSTPASPPTTPSDSDAGAEAPATDAAADDAFGDAATEDAAIGDAATGDAGAADDAATTEEAPADSSSDSDSLFE